MKIDEIKLASYLEDFDDFSDGANIENDEIKSWIKEGIDDIKNDFLENKKLKKTHTAISSGNTKVFIEGYKQNGGKYTIDVSISRAFFDRMYIDIEL